MEGAKEQRAETPNSSSADELRSTLRFLLFPGLVLAAHLLFGLPVWLLYACAGVLGVLLFVRSLSQPEWLLAVCILYMPLSKLYAVPVAPGINGLNCLIGMLAVSCYANAARAGKPMFVRMPSSRLVAVWACITCFSAVTATLRFGLSFMIEDQLLDYAAWVDQFIIFFLILNLIRDGAMAKRLVVYMMLGYLLVMFLGVQEMLEKSGLSSIEKSRVLGPQLQPNDFGAFLVYGMGPCIAYFLVHLFQLRAWLLVPFVGLAVKLVLSTFSRGAYIGVALAGLAAGYVRGKRFLALGGLAAVGVLIAFPQVLPESLVSRMSQTKVEGEASEQLDRSSDLRLTLWKAAIDISLDYPVLGTGFRGFPIMKRNYIDESTEVRDRNNDLVEVGDNHNMFLYISSQMGIPALLAFLWILYRMYSMGAKLYRQSADSAVRDIGLGAVAMVAGVVAVNMFGSRMTGVDVNGNFWVYLAVLAHLWAEHQRAQQDRPLPGEAMGVQEAARA